MCTGLAQQAKNQEGQADYQGYHHNFITNTTVVNSNTQGNAEKAHDSSTGFFFKPIFFKQLQKSDGLFKVHECKVRREREKYTDEKKGRKAKLVQTKQRG